MVKIPALGIVGARSVRGLSANGAIAEPRKARPPLAAGTPKFSLYPLRMSRFAPRFHQPNLPETFLQNHTKYVFISPFPFTSTSVLSLEETLAAVWAWVVSVTWIFIVIPVLSMRLATFTVSPQMS